MMMKGAITFNRIFVAALICISASACNKIAGPSDEIASTTTATVIGTASCTDLDNTFSTLGDCQTITGAYCTSGWQTFSNGSLALCYTPAAGWESCGVTVFPEWLYTAYHLNSSTTGGYVITRSLLGCSSDVCRCTGAIELSPPAPDVFEPSDYLNSNCSIGSYCTCTIANCPWGESDIIIPSTPISSGLKWTLNLAPGSGTVAGSTDDQPSVTMTGALPSKATGPKMRIYLYRDALCSTAATGSVTPAYTEIDTTGTSGGPIATDPRTGESGYKSFFFKIYDPVTDKSTGCVMVPDSTYLLYSTPVITSTGALFPTGQKIPGETMTVDFYDSNISGDSGMTYTDCKFDREVDGSATSGTPCTSLNSYSPVCTSITNCFSSTGSFTWIPANTDFGPYEICVTGYNMAVGPLSPVTGCAAFNVQPPIFTQALTHYWDAQFARNGGAGINTPNTIRTTALTGLVLGTQSGSLANFNYKSGTGWKGNITTTSVANEHSLELDGTDDYIDFGTGNNNFTQEVIDVWVMPQDVTQAGTRIIFSHGDSGAGTTGKGMTLSQVAGASAKFKLSIGEPATSTFSCTSGVTVMDYHWYHITASYDATGGLKMYVNNSLVSGCTQTGSVTLGGSGRNLIFGKSAVGTANTNWKGRFGNLKIYNSTANVATIAEKNHGSVTYPGGERQRFVFVDNSSISQLPNDIANLGLWLNSENIPSLESGNPVTSWPDLSTKNYDLVSALIPPSFEINNSVANGYPAVRFLGTGRMQNASVVFPANYTVFVVGKITNGNTGRNPFISNGAGGTALTYNLSLLGSGMGGSSGYIEGVFGDGATVRTTTSTSLQYNTATTPYTIIEKIKYAGSGEDIYRDGVLATTSVVGATTTSSGGTGLLFVGCNPSASLIGDILEIVVYERTLTAGERLNVERYLGTKYGITVP